MYTYLFSNDQCIQHEILERSLGVKVVEGVGYVERLVDGMVHHRRGKMIETNHVRYFMGFRVL